MNDKCLRFSLGTLVFLFIAQIISGQNIEGYVHCSNDKPVPFANIVLYSLPDSSFVTGTTSDMDGYFIIDQEKEQNNKNGYLSISSIGYETAAVKARSNMGIISLAETMTALNEVTVKARVPVAKQIEGKLVVNVIGTSLSKAGTVFDALRRSPGLLVDNNNNILVFGKGKPVIFLNGIEVKNQSEIENLQSSDIVSFEVDRNPSTEYSATATSVIRITTKKATKDRLSAQVYNYSTMGRKYRNTAGANLNGKSGKTRYTLNYSYSLLNYENLEDAYEINMQPDYTITNKNSNVRESELHKHNLFASILHELNDKHSIGAQATVMKRDSDTDAHLDQTIERSDDPTIVDRDIDKKSDGNYNVSTYSLNYLFKMDSLSSLSIIGDYSTVDEQSAEDIKEQDLSDQSTIHTLIEGQNDYNVYSGRLDYETTFNKIQLKAGGKFSTVNKDGKTVSTDLSSSEINYTDINSIDDKVYAGYTNIKYRFNSTSIAAGLRYERTSTMVKTGEKTDVDSTYNNWFPYFSFNKDLSENASLSITYTNKISRPSFRELSTDIIYFDANSYSVGNPELKPTIRTSYDLSLSLFRSLMINASYSKDKNARVLGAISDENNPDIVKYTPVNIDKAEYISASLEYSLSEDWYGNTISVGAEKPSIEIPYLDEIRKTKKLYYMFKINNNFTFSKRTSAYIDFVYKSEREHLMTRYDSRYNLSLGISTYFFDKKLKAGLIANDILNTSDSSWEDKFGNIIAGSNPDFDNTYVRLYLTYTFKNFKGGIKKKSAGSDALNRM